MQYEKGLLLCFQKCFFEVVILIIPCDLRYYCQKSYKYTNYIFRFNKNFQISEMAESTNSSEVQPSEANAQAKSLALAKIKEDAFAHIAKYLKEFQEGLRDKREPFLFAPFDKINGNLISFMKEFPAKTNSNRVLRVCSPFIYRIIGLLGLIASKSKTLSEKPEEKNLKVFINLAGKLDTPLGTLITSFQDDPEKWPASDHWKSLEGALKKLSECVLNLQYDTKMGTFSIL